MNAGHLLATTKRPHSCLSRRVRSGDTWWTWLGCADFGLADGRAVPVEWSLSLKAT